MQGTRFPAGAWGKAPIVSHAKHKSENQGAKRYLIPLNPVFTAAKRRRESEGIGVTRPLCGIQRDGNRKSQGARARSRSGRVCRRQRTASLCEFPGRFPLRQVLGRQPYRFPMRSIIKQESGSEATLIPLTQVKTIAKRRRESEGKIPSGRF